MKNYSSGSPRVHISSDETSINAAIEEYEAKITLFSNKDQLFLRELIDDLHEELAIRHTEEA